MLIREAEKRDAASVSELLAQLGYPAGEDSCLERIAEFKREGYHLIVGEKDQRLVGFIALHWHQVIHHPRSLGRIVAFCVDESERGHGLGSQLLRYAEDFLQKKDCFKVEVTSNLRRAQTHRYYFEQGYKQKSMHFVKLFPA